jgi:hypothetical protein
MGYHLIFHHNGFFLPFLFINLVTVVRGFSSLNFKESNFILIAGMVFSKFSHIQIVPKSEA